MEPLFEHRMEFAGIETRVLELEGTGDPFMLFHGWSDSADTWRHVLDLLARNDRRAIAVDLPGFGTADPLAAGPMLPQLDAFGAEAVAYAAADIRPARGRSRARRAAAARRGRAGRARGRRRAVVVGNSLGGCLALRLAQQRSVGGVEVARCVALAPAGLEMAPWFRLIERDPVLRGLLALPVPLPGRALQEVVGRVYGALAFAHPRAVEPGVARAFARHHPDRAAVARLLASGRRLLPELRDCFELSEIECPVQLIWGDRDRMVYASGAERVLSEVADARLELLEDTGHCPQIERCERVVELLLGDAGVAASRLTRRRAPSADATRRAPPTPPVRAHLPDFPRDGPDSHAGAAERGRRQRLRPRHARRAGGPAAAAVGDRRRGPQRTVRRYLRPGEPAGSAAAEASRPPVLLVPPLAAPATCFDLRRGCSVAEHLLAAGHRPTSSTTARSTSATATSASSTGSTR